MLIGRLSNACRAPIGRLAMASAKSTTAHFVLPILINSLITDFNLEIIRLTVLIRNETLSKSILSAVRTIL